MELSIVVIAKLRRLRIHLCCSGACVSSGFTGQESRARCTHRAASGKDATSMVAEGANSSPRFIIANLHCTQTYALCVSKRFFASCCALTQRNAPRGVPQLVAPVAVAHHALDVEVDVAALAWQRSALRQRAAGHGGNQTRCMPGWCTPPARTAAHRCRTRQCLKSAGQARVSIDVSPRHKAAASPYRRGSPPSGPPSPSPPRAGPGCRLPASRAAPAKASNASGLNAAAPRSMHRCAPAA
jgi:hypothetical protein